MIVDTNVFGFFLLSFFIQEYKYWWLSEHEQRALLVTIEQAMQPIAEKYAGRLAKAIRATAVNVARRDRIERNASRIPSVTNPRYNEDA